MNLNLVQLIGRVGGDPEVKSLPSGRLVASFSIATNRTWVQDGKKQEQTEWHNVVFFGDNLIEKLIAPYVKRGSEIYVAGRIQTRSWEKDGQKHYRTEVVGDVIQLGASPRNGERGNRKDSDDAVDDALEDAFSEDKPARKPSAKKTTGRKSSGTGDVADDINPDDIPF